VKRSETAESSRVKLSFFISPTFDVASATDYEINLTI
jgi:hypothetical protein